MRRDILAPIAFRSQHPFPLFHMLTHYILVLIYTCSFFGGALLLDTTTASAAAVPGGNIADAGVRAVDLAKPAVVRIITTMGGRLSVRFPTGNAAVAFPQNGGNYDLKLSGSGTFISSTGDIITADHVIKPPQDHSMDMALEQIAAQDIADYVNQHFAASTAYSKNDVIGALDSGYFLSQKSYTSSTSEVYLSTDYTGPISAQDLQFVPTAMRAKVDKVLKESAVDQEDMAIIHVNMTNTPSVQFGDSSQVAQQDNLTIIGFPGNGDISDRKDPTTFLTSSINKIFVSALKKTDSGADVIQVGGNVEHGDSGGPALDANGNIVGIVSFGLESTPPYGSSFLQTSNHAKTWLAALHLDTRPGSMQRAWQQAFTDYASAQPGHWHKAQGDFLKLTQSYPDFKASTPFLVYANHEAQTESPTEGQSNDKFLPNYLSYLKQNVILLIIVSVLSILLLFLAIWAFTRRRRSSSFINTTQTQSSTMSYSRPIPNMPPQPTPPQQPYMSGRLTGAPPLVSDPRLQGQPPQYSPRIGTDQINLGSRSKEQDYVPTRPLKTDA